MPTSSKDMPTTDPAAGLTPTERLTQLIEKYGPSEDVIPDDESDQDPAAFLEENPLLFVIFSRTGDAPWLSLHPSQESAAECWASEECPEYWDPRVLIDLRTGVEFIAAEYSSVAFTPAGGPSGVVA